MSANTMEMRRALEEIFGPRANFDPTERELYGHDIAAIPSLVKPLIGNTTPDAVVQPADETEIVDLVRWAAKERCPLTPRGKASSGYGGAVPLERGIVVDFFRMQKVRDVDVENETVTVQPGITWEKLERTLGPHGLALRLYPTSAPSSTVGGWLAQGGAGIGSYQYGWFSSNVVSARVVLPNAEVREVSGEDLDLVADAEGITGFITEVTLRVQRQQDLALAAAAFPDAEKLQDAIQAIADADLPIWSLVFINPRMAELKNRSPMLEHHGHPTEERVILPAAYLATLAFRAEHREQVTKALEEIAHRFEGEVLAERIAEHEWQHRFKLMVVKRLGPSLVPAEVVVPLSRLGAAMADIERKVNQPIVKEGVIIRQGTGGEPEAVILGFIPSDQRHFTYNFVFGLVLTVMKIAERHGGRPYATGLYFSKWAYHILGRERTSRLRGLKMRVDPHGIMNPRKVIGNGMLGMALSLAGQFEPLIRPFGNHVITQIGERPAAPVRDIPPDVAWYAYSCSQCGYCVEECDQFYGRGWESQSPRGKWYWLRQYMEGHANWDQKMVDTILACTTCELCNQRCSAALPIEPSWMKLRGQLVEEKRKMTFPPFEIMAAALHKEGDIWAGYRRDRSNWFPEDLKAKHWPGKKAPAVYFAGCTASYVEHDIGQASARLLDEAGVDYTYMGEKESCCGTPMLVAGKWDLFAQTLRKNVAAVKATGADTVISSCPACDMMWRWVYPEWAEKLGIPYQIQAKHYSEVISDKLKEGTFKFTHEVPATKVTWHDSCHIGRVSGVYEPPRDVIKAIPGVEFVEMTHHHEEAHCCGSVLTLLKDPQVAHDVGDIRLKEATVVGAEAVLALCPCCQFQLRLASEKRGSHVPVHDLASFACRGLGFEFEDPNPEVMRQWAVFEAMIALMTPRGFAGLMDTMWPELLDAMPLKMGAIMRAVGQAGPLGGLVLNAMRPAYPVLFPRLLPAMMPKVMETMLERVGQQIPMPDYMREQMP
ncbi:MAG: FAD-binding and (Fe-S)-binding domain-containing protein, partial [Dehalococcoidales bacterium]|nr:FAD-binding and (Fe-S)-binding domain-containing protein [Dehalococcoidales bacterium]